MAIETKFHIRWMTPNSWKIEMNPGPYASQLIFVDQWLQIIKDTCHSSDSWKTFTCITKELLPELEALVNKQLFLLSFLWPTSLQPAGINTKHQQDIGFATYNLIYLWKNLHKNMLKVTQQWAQSQPYESWSQSVRPSPMITNSCDKIPWLPIDFISSQWWV
jgi:hypothetical protein